MNIISENPLDHWYFCPHCGKKLFRYLPETRVHKLPVWCRRCHAETLLTMEQETVQAGA